jgi:hypothetical protein
MHRYVSSLSGELSPGLVLALSALLGGAAAYLPLCQTARGRARSAIAYLAGLAAGLTATACAVAALHSKADGDAMAVAGLLGSFFGPFLGMLRARWRRKHRPARRRAMAEGLSRP